MRPLSSNLKRECLRRKGDPQKRRGDLVREQGILDFHWSGSITKGERAS